MCTDYIHQNTDHNPIHLLNNSNINGVINENNQTRRAV